MVYYALMSAVPLLVLLLAILGLMLRFSDAAAAAEQQVLLTVEANLGTQLRQATEQLFEQLQRESMLAATISAVGLLLTASALFRHLRLSFRAIWKQTPPLVAGRARAVIRAASLEYAVASLMVLFGGVLLVLALALVSITQWLSDLVVAIPGVRRAPAWVLALPSSAIIVGLTFAFLLKVLPPIRLRWRHVRLATIVCTLSWIAGAELVVMFGALYRRSPSALGAFRRTARDDPLDQCRQQAALLWRRSVQGGSFE
jgi:membrane protein